jgi:hypothetical protein
MPLGFPPLATAALSVHGLVQHEIDDFRGRALFRASIF